MLKVVVFDSGYGGELFADQLKEALPIIDVIRVIDWRNAEGLLLSPKNARKIAENALRPYINRTDLIIFANHLLSATSLKYFKRKYKSQKFLGFNFKSPDTFKKQETLILTTKAVTKTIGFQNFLIHLKRRTKTLSLDSWPEKIDDGELSEMEINETLKKYLFKDNFSPQEVILACSQFSDIKCEIKKSLGQNIKIYDSFNDAIKDTHKILNLRGGTGKKK